MQEFDPDKRPIIIHGGGNSAAITALALAAAGCRPFISRPNAPVTKQKNKPKNQPKNSDVSNDNAPSVLALSAAAKTMLESLSVWSRLKTPGTPVLDMAVYDSAENWRRDDGLSFAEPVDATKSDAAKSDAAHTDKTASAKNASTETAVNVLAHIVGLSDLSAAINAALEAALAEESVRALPAHISDFDKTDGTVTLQNGETITAALLIDTSRDAPWQRDSAAMRHDYDMAALVASVKTGRPHGHKAIQLFLPDGPLALLPLSAPDKRALIWSMPKQKAAALAALGQPFLDAELAKATASTDGKISADDNAQVQDLSLKLADTYCDGHLCLIGEAAHIVHPLAGQGFNLTLRDAALLADCLYDARRLGLAADGPYVLADFITRRRGDAALTAAITHSLADLFSGPLKNLSRPLGRIGLALTGRMARHNQALRHAFRRQADGGGASPRLMRSENFQ